MPISPRPEYNVGVARVAITIAPGALIRGQDGLDLLATGRAFVAALEPVLRTELPEIEELSLTLDAGLTAHRVEVSAADERLAQRIDREVRDRIWVVREMIPFAVPG